MSEKRGEKLTKCKLEAKDELFQKHSAIKRTGQQVRR